MIKFLGKKTVGLWLFVFWASAFRAITAQDVLEVTPEEAFVAWNEARAGFLKSIIDARSEVMNELAKMDASARTEGDFESVKKLVQSQREFEENGDLPDMVNGEAYESARRKAETDFEANTKSILTSLLKLREDALAEVVATERSWLLDRSVADAYSRWSSAESNYGSEITGARERVVQQFEKAQNQARERGDVGLAESYKKSVDTFLDSGTLMDLSLRATYEQQLQKAKKKLEAAHRSIIRSASATGNQAVVADLEKKLAEAFDPSIRKSPLGLIQKKVDKENMAAKRSNDSRKSWRNDTYRAHITWKQGEEWEEIDDATGQLKWHYRETARNDDYIEMVLIERNHTIRIFDDRADIFLEGEWRFVSGGGWKK